MYLVSVKINIFSSVVLKLEKNIANFDVSIWSLKLQESAKIIFQRKPQIWP